MLRIAMTTIIAITCVACKPYTPSAEFEIQPPLDQVISLDDCKVAAYLWQCAVVNKTSEQIYLGNVWYIGYTADGTKIEEHSMFGNLDPNGRKLHRFAISDTNEDPVSKIVVRFRNDNDS